MKERTLPTLWAHLSRPIQAHRETVLAQPTWMRWAQFLVVWAISLFIADSLLIYMVQGKIGI
jgi:hypothetical protein